MNDPILHDPPTPFAAEFPLRQPEAQLATAKVVPLLARIPLRSLTARHVQDALRDEAINQQFRDEMTLRHEAIADLMLMVDAYGVETVETWLASLRRTLPGGAR